MKGHILKPETFFGDLNQWVVADPMQLYNAFPTHTFLFINYT